MNKIILLILALTASTVISQSCTSTFLSDGFEFSLSSSRSGSGLSYCKSLQAGNTCCSASIVNNFQVDADEWIANYEELAAIRDRLFVQRREKAFNNTQKYVKLLNAATAAIAAVPSEVREELSQEIRQITQIVDPIANDFEGFQTNFTLFQEARATCMIEAGHVQAAAWCLACDPNQASKGVGEGLALSSELQERLLDACYDYIELSSSQSNIHKTHYLEDYLSDLTSGLETAANGDFEGGFVKFFETREAYYNQELGTNTTQLPAYLYSSCSSDECDWFFYRVFYDGVFQEETLSIGGNPRNPILETRLLGESFSRGRQLQANEWKPAKDEAGITVTFKVDPANVNFAFRSGIVICALTALVTLLF